MKRKKSYNPFKMWGSYVGLISALLYIILIAKDNPFSFSSCSSFFICTPPILIYGIPLFFIGYGIHALIRRFKK